MVKQAGKIIAREFFKPNLPSFVWLVRVTSRNTTSDFSTGGYAILRSRTFSFLVDICSTSLSSDRVQVLHRPVETAEVYRPPIRPFIHRSASQFYLNSS